MMNKPTIEERPDGDIHVHIPMFLKRKDGRKMVITPKAIDGDVPNAESHIQESVAMAIVRAHAWAELLEKKEVETITDLSNLLKIDGSYLTRLLKLTTLAPDIIEAIFNGEEPDGLSLSKLVQPFPDDWSEQRQHFGFQIATTI